MQKFAKNTLAMALALALPMVSMAQTSDPAQDAITSGSTKILAYVAVGGAALVAIKLAMVGWVVASKWIGRLAGRS